MAENIKRIAEMKAHDEPHQGTLAELREVIAVGVEQADRGQVHPFNEETTARVQERGRKRSAAQNGPKPS